MIILCWTSIYIVSYLLSCSFKDLVVSILVVSVLSFLIFIAGQSSVITRAEKELPHHLQCSVQLFLYSIEQQQQQQQLYMCGCFYT